MTTSLSTFVVPAETWEQLTDMNSCAIVANGGYKLVTVKAQHYQGRLYTSFSTLYAGFGGLMPSYIGAYELWPLAQYTGITYDSHLDEEAIALGKRQRGDHQGVVVKVKGKQWVCARYVRLEMGLPSSSQRLSLTEAKAWLEEHFGRMSIEYPIEHGRWAAFEGHPVRCFTQYGSGRRRLLYRSLTGDITCTELHESLALDSVDTLGAKNLPKEVVVSQHGQLGMLF
tara:strand:- start:1998 stop:2678 length:681 start_codon:yes stop_codon:yes gene_type:complete